MLWTWGHCSDGIHFLKWTPNRWALYADGRCSELVLIQVLLHTYTNIKIDIKLEMILFICSKSLL